jgi:hypothetical protein
MVLTPANEVAGALGFRNVGHDVPTPLTFRPPLLTSLCSRALPHLSRCGSRCIGQLPLVPPAYDYQSQEFLSPDTSL